MIWLPVTAVACTPAVYANQLANYSLIRKQVKNRETVDLPVLSVRMCVQSSVELRCVLRPDRQ